MQHGAKTLRPLGTSCTVVSSCGSCSLASTKPWTTRWHVSAWAVAHVASREAVLVVDAGSTHMAVTFAQPCRAGDCCGAGILALPADHAGDLAAAFAALWQHSALPPLMQTGAMESAAVLRQYVLVHDAASQGAEVLAAAKERLRQLGSTLGARCQVLSINSGTGGAPPSGLHLWGDMVHDSVPGGGGGEPAMRSPAPPGGLGAWLSEADVLTLSAFVHELAVRSLLPHMEMRLRALNVQVCAVVFLFSQELARCCQQVRRASCCPGYSQPQRFEEPAEKPVVAQRGHCWRQPGQCHPFWHAF